MNLEQWNLLKVMEKRALASKYGVTLKGLDELWSEDELKKIPEPKIIELKAEEPIEEIKLDVKPKKQVKKLGAKKPVKRSLGARVVPKLGSVKGKGLPKSGKRA